MYTSAGAVSLTATAARRIESIDLLRGAIMIIMALDHIRDFFHHSAFVFNPTDLTHTTPYIFFTRWITHFCAPIFVLLAGTSARISGAKKTKKELSFFLLTRGIWLILIEIVIMSFALTFNPEYPIFALLVLWSIGWCMICLSVLIYLPVQFILVFGILLIAGHNALDGIGVHGSGLKSFLWSFLHVQHVFIVDHRTVLVAYPIVPWIGVMALGYCLGGLYLPGFDAEKRKKFLSFLGWGSIALFVLLRWSNIYGDSSPWTTQRNALYSLLSFLNTTKYPPSLLYLLMTLGPGLVFLSVTERPLSSFAQKITVYGRVPLFYYVLHFFWVHLLALVAAALTGFKWSAMILNTFVTFSPGLKGYGFSLPVVYLIWIAVVISLYPACKWFDRYKRNHRSTWWLSYL